MNVILRMNGDPVRYAAPKGVTVDPGDAVIVDADSFDNETSFRVLAVKRAAAPLFTAGMRETSGSVTVEVVDIATHEVVRLLVMNSVGVIRSKAVAA